MKTHAPPEAAKKRSGSGPGPRPQAKLRLGHAADSQEKAADAFATRLAGSAPEAKPKAPVRKNAPPADLADVEARVRSPGGGRPLPEGVRRHFETRIGHDLAHVRVHENPQARADAEGLKARAFTYAHHIWLGPGERVEDAPLIAHELAHVAQQDAVVRRAPAENPADPPEDEGGFLGWIKRKAANWLKDKKSYELVKTLLGEDPLTHEKHPRDMGKVMEIMSEYVSDSIASVLKVFIQAGSALLKAFNWFMGELEKAGLTWQAVKSRIAAIFEQAWDHKLDAIDILKDGFGKLIDDVIDFAKRIGGQIIDYLFDVLISLVDPDGQLRELLRKAGAAFSFIVHHPIEFFKRLLSAIGSGFARFGSNILEHLKNAFFAWLTDALGGLVKHLPRELSLKSLGSLALEILGLTYERIRAVIVKVIGEERVAQAESVVKFVLEIKEKGISAIFDKIGEFFGNLADQVVGIVTGWLKETIVGKALQKIATLLVPAAGLITAIQAGYNAVMTLIENGKRIIAIIKSFFDTLTDIIDGKVEGAAQFIEKILAGALPLVISFLAKFLGLDKIGTYVKEQIHKVQSLVEKGMHKIAEFVAKQLTKLGGAIKKGLQKLFGTPFKMGSASHELYAEQQPDGKTVIVMASENPKPFVERVKDVRKQVKDENEATADLIEILDRYETRALEVEKGLTALGPATDANKKARQPFEQSINSMSYLLQKYANDYGVDDLEFRPKDHGDEGKITTYSETKKAKKDPNSGDMVGDHEPQDEVMKLLPKIVIDVGNRVDVSLYKTKYTTGQGVALNMRAARHASTRTFGSKGGETKRKTAKDMGLDNPDADKLKLKPSADNAASNGSLVFKDKDAARRQVRQALKDAIDADQKTVKHIYNVLWKGKVSPKTVDLVAKAEAGGMYEENKTAWSEVYKF